MVLTRPNGEIRKVESRALKQGPILWGGEGRPYIMGRGGEGGDDGDSSVVSHAALNHKVAGSIPTPRGRGDQS